MLETASAGLSLVQGVLNYFDKRLEIVGVGYRAILEGAKLKLSVGFSNTVELPVPESVVCELPDNTHIVLKSADKQAVGQFAAVSRRVRPPHRALNDALACRSVWRWMEDRDDFNGAVTGSDQTS